MANFATWTNNGPGLKVYCSAFQSFIPSATHLCTAIYLSLAINTDQAATVATITLQPTSDGKPTGEILAIMGTIANTDLTTTYTWKIFNSDSVVLTGGITYAIVMTLVGDTICSGGGVTDSGIRWEGTNGYADGIGWQKECALNGSWACALTWSSAALDWNFIDEGTAAPSKPTNPSPSNAASNITLDETPLSWVDGGNTDTYEIYWRIQGDEWVLVGVAQADVEWTIDFGTLAYGITYEWRIDATNEAGTTTGDTWSFGSIAFDQIRVSYRLISGGNGNGPYDSPPGVQGTDWEYTGESNMTTIKKLIAAANNKIWIEDI